MAQERSHKDKGTDAGPALESNIQGRPPVRHFAQRESELILARIKAIDTLV